MRFAIVITFSCQQTNWKMNVVLSHYMMHFQLTNNILKSNNVAFCTTYTLCTTLKIEVCHTEKSCTTCIINYLWTVIYVNALYFRFGSTIDYSFRFCRYVSSICKYYGAVICEHPPWREGTGGGGRTRGYSRGTWSQLVDNGNDCCLKRYYHIRSIKKPSWRLSEKATLWQNCRWDSTWLTCPLSVNLGFPIVDLNGIIDSINCVFTLNTIRLPSLPCFYYLFGEQPEISWRLHPRAQNAAYIVDIWSYCWIAMLSN